MGCNRQEGDLLGYTLFIVPLALPCARGAGHTLHLKGSGLPPATPCQHSSKQGCDAHSMLATHLDHHLKHASDDVKLGATCSQAPIEGGGGVAFHSSTTVTVTVFGYNMTRSPATTHARTQWCCQAHTTSLPTEHNIPHEHTANGWSARVVQTAHLLRVTRLSNLASSSLEVSAHSQCVNSPECSHPPTHTCTLRPCRLAHGG
jgi:hypothetical protein